MTSKKGRSRLPAKKRRAAKAVALGRSNAAAAAAAGIKSKRAQRGVTVAEWKRDPEFLALVEKYADESMTGNEWEAINADMARLKTPERIITDGQGRIVQKIYSRDKAMDRQGNNLGKLRDRHILTGPNDGPIQHELANVPEQVLRQRLAKNLEAIGGAQAGG